MPMKITTPSRAGGITSALDRGKIHTIIQWIIQLLFSEAHHCVPTIVLDVQAHYCDFLHKAAQYLSLKAVNK